MLHSSSRYPLRLLLAVAGGLLRQLQKGFSPEGGFWEQTGYHDAAHPFSSYLYVLVSKGTSPLLHQH